MEKRELPTHVDGRIKIGFMTLKNFLIILPFCIIIALIAILNFSPISVCVAGTLIMLLVYLVSDLGHGEIGIETIKNIIRYEKEGDIEFERISIIPIHKRFIKNNIERKYTNEENI